MEAPAPHSTSDKPDAEHQFLLSYLNSSAWEERLAEARIKRRAIADAGAAEARHRERQGDGSGSASPRPRTPDRAPAGAQASAIGTDALAIPDVERPLAVAAPTAARRSMTVPLVGLCVVVCLAGGVAFWRSTGGAGPVSPSPDDLASIEAVTDVVSRNRTGAPLDLGVGTRSATTGPGAAAPSAGLAALVASLEDASLTHSVTIVTSARQAEALSRLPRAETSAPAMRVTPFALPRSTVTFYHAADAEAAQRLADRIDGETMDLTGLLPAPPTGTLALYLAGS